MQSHFNKIIEKVEHLQAIYVSDREGAIVIKGIDYTYEPPSIDTCD